MLKATVKHINAINIWYHMHDVKMLGVAFSRVNRDIYEMMFETCDNLIKSLRVESMHLHKYETVELYAQSDGGAFAQSDDEAY